MLYTFETAATNRAPPRLKLLEELVYGLSQMPVLVGHNTACIMRVQLNAHIAVLVVKTGVMGMFLCQESHTRHEGECFLKILEPKFSDQPVVFLEPHLSRFIP